MSSDSAALQSYYADSLLYLLRGLARNANGQALAFAYSRDNDVEPRLASVLMKDWTQ